jgi:glycosyltransferase involved in cell wall biosynthesis
MTFNRPASLAGCLRSIAGLEWHGRAPEVIVVDDGSEPPSREVALATAPALDVTYVHQSNRGVASARNRGLRASTGTHVGFIADDYALPPRYLSDVDAFFDANPDALVITHNVAPRRAGFFSMVQRLYMQLAIGQELEPGALANGIVRSFTLPASRAAVFDRSVFDRVGDFDERLRQGEDGDLGRRLAAAGIPVHMFFWKAVEHREGTGLVNYLRQRVRYGRSFMRVLGGGIARPHFERRGALGVVTASAQKMRIWWRVAERLGIRVRFVLLAPFIALFLFAFHVGAYLEYRDPCRSPS